MLVLEDYMKKKTQNCKATESLRLFPLCDLFFWLPLARIEFQRCTNCPRMHGKALKRKSYCSIFWPETLQSQTFHFTQILVQLFLTLKTIFWILQIGHNFAAAQIFFMNYFSFDFWQILSNSIDIHTLHNFSNVQFYNTLRSFQFYIPLASIFSSPCHSDAPHFQAFGGR